MVLSQTLRSLVVASAIAFGSAQLSPAVLQSVGFNSSFSLSAAQIAAANLSDSTVASLNNILNFDRSQLANGGPSEDDFYTLPPLTNETGPLEPGILLKAQPFTDLTSYALPPNTALSRILYTTTNINGTVIPTSAFVLWPFQPRQVQQKKEAAAPAVLWTHGTSGFFRSAAPSSHRALWYGDYAPFALALAGYAVVAPDYAGVGISTSWDGTPIPHQYLMSPASARDALYAMQAALEAFPDLLTEEFVTVGHSQGGGVAWGVAEAIAQDPSLGPGYLGTVAGSPTTDAFSGVPEFIVSWTSLAMKGIFPDFEPSTVLSPLGIARTALLKEVQGGISASQYLFLTGETIILDNYNETWYVDAYSKLANAGRKPAKGPLLVIQGTEDAYVPYSVTAPTVEDTCALYPETDLEFLVVDGVGHVPVLDASRHTWMQWIEDRFTGKATAGIQCRRTELNSFLPIERYQKTGNSFPMWAGAAEYSYETPLGS
ncbi:alpha/beta-hydrolase [Thozetella sp. PMI_491]|nr:alpha/beta-hydrolase [Thozetella sp. PMI_491]